jgi:hypothetical protein
VIIDGAEPQQDLLRDTMSASTFWHGSKMENWANAWTRYYTGGKGNYMVAAMEDSGTLQSLTFLSRAGRLDLRRVLVLRTVSNYDRKVAGTTPADSLKGTAERGIVEHSAERAVMIPTAE